MELINRRNYTTYFNDFIEIADFGAAVTGSGTAGDWTVTAIGTMTVGTAAITGDSESGLLTLTPDATDNEGYHIQMTAADSAGELWTPATGRVISFEAYVTAGDWDGQDYFIGLAETSATLVGATGALTCDNLVGFHHLIADVGLIQCVHTGTADANETRVGTANPVIFTDSALHRFGVRVINTNRVEWFVDGQLVRRATMTVPFDDKMCISFGNVGSNAATDILAIDYVTVSQTRA
jgi:hypothetical protein